MIQELVTTSRSYRRFYEDQPVGETTLRDLVDLARLSPSGGNLQPLKYLLSATPEQNARIFPHLRWASYLPDWNGPEPGERPAAYIVILLDRTISANAGCDHGIACQSILLGAREKGFGGVIIGNVNRKALVQTLGLAENLEPLLVLALGRPNETVVIEEMQPGGSHKYYRDAASVHHVPKRRLGDILVAWSEAAPRNGSDA
jgi:nitroreductase